MTVWRALSAIGVIATFVGLWCLVVRPSVVRAPTEVVVSVPQSLEGLPLRGSPDARVGVILFSDFQCPACGRLARDVLPVIDAEYVKTGRVLLAFSDLPLEAIHSAAVRRAAIAECARRQDRFWEVHDRLFARQNDPSIETVSVKGLNAEALAVCLSGGSVEVVRQRRAKAEALGIRSTPTLLLGYVAANELKVADTVIGFRTAEHLSAMLDRLLTR